MKKVKKVVLVLIILMGSLQSIDASKLFSKIELSPIENIATQIPETEHNSLNTLQEDPTEDHLVIYFLSCYIQQATKITTFLFAENHYEKSTLDLFQPPRF